MDALGEHRARDLLELAAQRGAREMIALPGLAQIGIGSELRMQAALGELVELVIHQGGQMFFHGDSKM